MLKLVALMSAVSLSFLLTGCGPGDAEVADDPLATESTSSELLASEASALQFMREEEKLARDVYLAMDALWNQPIFANIASSEQTHMDTVLMLLTRFRLADPAAGKAPGEFTDPTIQALYAQLVARGSVSATEALKVGALIEDLDIADLMRLSGETTRPDVLRVYANLTKGSRNHLRSFYEQLGGDYTPQYLDLATFTAIVTSPAETGPAR